MSTGLHEAYPTRINHIASTINLNGGSMLRGSMNPSLPVSQVLLTTMHSESVYVDSTVPVVVNVTTTSIPGYYSMNDLIDFHVTFNTKVMIAQVVIPHVKNDQ